jgi:hypothetical protein
MMSAYPLTEEKLRKIVRKPAERRAAYRIQEG